MALCTLVLDSMHFFLRLFMSTIAGKLCPCVLSFLISPQSPISCDEELCMGNRDRHCIAGHFRQQKISPKATVRQFVGNLFSSNVSPRSFALRSFVRHSFAYRLSSHS